MTPSLFTILGVALGTTIGATLELSGHAYSTCFAAVVAAQVVYVGTWLLVQEKLKHRRASRVSHQ